MQGVGGSLAVRAVTAEREMEGAMSNEMTKRLVWAGLLAGIGALASILAARIAAVLYRRIYGEDPPE